jgi:DNA ligase (NAD+)
VSVLKPGKGDIVPPTHCPECEAPVSDVKQEGQARVIRCVNPSCPAQLKERLLFYAGREGVDIAGLGEQVIDQLVEKQIVRNIPDLYELKAGDLESLDRMGKVSAKKLVEAIQQSKSPPLDKFLHALSIPYTGAGTSKRLAKAFGSLYCVAMASLSELLAVPDIGEITANAIYDFFDNPKVAGELEHFCNELGVVPVWEPSETGTALAGKTIVVTGTLKKYGRKEIEAVIEKHGGKASSSVSKKTSFVVAGEAAGSKLDKAKELGIPVLSEDEFDALLNE